MKTFLKIIIVVMLTAIISDIAASFYFYNISIARSKRDFLSQDVALKKSVPASAVISLNKVSENEIDWFNPQTYEGIDIISDDGLKLKGYYLKAKIPTSKTVILAHGYSSQGTFMGSYAKFYYEKLGYNVLLPDDRGHGKSEGDYTGFGWLDRKDYLKWIGFIIHKVGQDSQIVLHGVSMGGATVLMTSGEELPENVKAVVSDCAYTSVKAELEYQLKRMYHLPSFPIINSTSILTKLRAGYFLEEASALKQVKKSKTPILFIHGAADEYVPFYMVNELYEACNSEKDLLVVPNAGHGASYSTDSNGYINKVREFIGKYVK
ncbi:MAG TPA: alpha/beta hydrolase [Ruminiclostridium sp.]